jgi:hypothetical protein
VHQGNGDEISWHKPVPWSFRKLCGNYPGGPAYQHDEVAAELGTSCRREEKARKIENPDTVKPLENVRV